MSSLITLACTALILAALWHIWRFIVATRAEFNQKLSDLADQSEKVKQEVLDALAELNNTNTTPEQDALLARIGAAVGDLDALRADTPPTDSSGQPVQG